MPWAGATLKHNWSHMWCLVHDAEEILRQMSSRLFDGAAVDLMWPEVSWCGLGNLSWLLLVAMRSVGQWPPLCGLPWLLDAHAVYIAPAHGVPCDCLLVALALPCISDLPFLVGWFLCRLVVLSSGVLSRYDWVLNERKVLGACDV